MIIYLTTNLINNKKYIGSTNNNNPYYLGSGVYLNKAIKKYGRKNFKREILETVSNLEELRKKEEYYIKLYNAINSKEFYNVSKKGVGTKPGYNSKIYTEERNKKIGLAHKGQKRYEGLGIKISEKTKNKPKPPRTKEHNEKIGLSNRGKSKLPMKEETKNKIKNSKIGIKQPNIDKSKKGYKMYNQEWKDKISKSLIGKHKNYLGHHKPIIQYDLQGNLLNEYQSAQEAGRYLNKSGNSIADCAAGKQKTAYGYKWKYK